MFVAAVQVLLLSPTSLQMGHCTVCAASLEAVTALVHPHFGLAVTLPECSKGLPVAVTLLVRGDHLITLKQTQIQPACMQ